MNKMNHESVRAFGLTAACLLLSSSLGCTALLKVDHTDDELGAYISKATYDDLQHRADLNELTVAQLLTTVGMPQQWLPYATNCEVWKYEGVSTTRCEGGLLFVASFHHEKVSRPSNFVAVVQTGDNARVLCIKPSDAPRSQSLLDAEFQKHLADQAKVDAKTEKDLADQAENNAKVATDAMNAALAQLNEAKESAKKTPSAPSKP